MVGRKTASGVVWLTRNDDEHKPAVCVCVVVVIAANKRGLSLPEMQQHTIDFLVMFFKVWPGGNAGSLIAL